MEKFHAPPARCFDYYYVMRNPNYGGGQAVSSARSRLLLFLLVLAALASGAGLAVPQEGSNEPTLKDQWKQAYRAIAESIEMRRGSTRFLLHDQALLYYTNPVRTNDQHGAIFLWTAAGRPAVLGSIWSALNRSDPTSRNVTHEWHSLIEDPDIQATRRGENLWQPGEPGIAWQVLPNSPVPSSSRAARLVQMRALARRLTARITAEEESELRLLPQPLYRYPEKIPDVRDGALFAYSLATDPEIVLLIELPDSASQPMYRVGVARFGNLAMSVRDGDQTIWSCERGTPGRSVGKYFLHWRAEQMPADPQSR
jgi:hypothetical protein